MLAAALHLLLTLTPADFIEIGDSFDGLKCELHLTDTANPLGVALLPKKACCVVHKGCFSNLLAAGLDAKSQGYQLKIVDALRPLYVQQALFAIIPNKKYISEPGGEDDLHTRGLSVDVLLTDKNGQVLPLPSAYLEATPRAFSDYRDCTENERYNREVLADIMVRNGFKPHPNRWWEFQSTYWDSVSPEGKKALTPFNHNLEELICPAKP